MKPTGQAAAAEISFTGSVRLASSRSPAETTEQRAAVDLLQARRAQDARDIGPDRQVGFAPRRQARGRGDEVLHASVGLGGPGVVWPLVPLDLGPERAGELNVAPVDELAQFSDESIEVGIGSDGAAGERALAIEARESSPCRRVDR